MTGAISANEGLLGEVLSRRGLQDDRSDGPVHREILLVVELPELGCRVELLSLGHELSLKACHAVDGDLVVASSPPALVGDPRLELGWVTPHAPQTCASTSSASRPAAAA